MISHLPLVVPVTWAVISLSVGEAGRGRYACQRLARVPTTAGFRGAFPASMSPAHKPHARVKQPMVTLHFTWTKCLREGLTHHTPENMNFTESPGPLESSPTTQGPSNTGEASHTTSGFQQGTRRSLGPGPRSTSRPLVPAKGPEHPVLTSGDLDQGHKKRGDLLPSITPQWVLSDKAPPAHQGREGPPSLSSRDLQHSTAQQRPGPARDQRAFRRAHLLPDTWVTD